MGDQALVRARSLVLVAGAYACAAACALSLSGRSTQAWQAEAPKAAASADGEVSEEVPLERLPYKIRAWVSVRPGTMLDARGREAAVHGWRQLVRRLVGVPWSLEVVDGPDPMSSTTLESLVAETVAAAAQGCEKAWIFRIEQNGGGYSLSARALDVPTARLGPVARREAPYPDDLARDLMALSLELFTPSAEIGGLSPNGVELVVRGASLPVSDPIARIVEPNDVFRILRVGLSEDGAITRVQDVPYSYLRVLNVRGGRALCEVRTGIRDPLTRAVLGRSKIAAVGVKPARTPTRLRFLTDAVDRRPAAGYTVIAREVPNGPPRELGFTDREGRLTIDAGFADELLVLRVLAAGVEPLREFPIMPGETTEERIVPVDPLNKTVAIDTHLNALRDEIVDLVAVRNRLERRMKTRAEAGFWDDLPPMLEEFRKFPGHDQYAERLNKIKEDAAKEQMEVRKVILTRHAQSLIADTQALIEKYLDDGMILGIEQAYKEAKGLVAKTNTPGKAQPKGAPQPKAAAPQQQPPPREQPKQQPKTKAAPKGGVNPF